MRNETPSALGVSRTASRWAGNDERSSLGSANAFAAWLCLVGLIIPAAEVAFYIGGMKFTVGRLGIVLLLAPAVIKLLMKPRRFIGADVMILATGGWIIIAGAVAPGSKSLSSSVAEALELCGGYFVARAYFFGPSGLQAFLAALKILSLAAIALAFVDSISGRLYIHEMAGAAFHVPPIDFQERGNGIRATATFDHAILLGAFCCVTGAILLHSESSPARRLFFGSACLFGAVLSWSSSALMGFVMVAVAAAYNASLGHFAKRWVFLWLGVTIIGVAFFLSSQHPMGWIISHMTLDPVTGYYRLMIWDAVFAKLPDSPIFGFGFNEFGNYILDTTVDSVWLVMALRFGQPTTLLMIAASIAVVLPAPFPPESETDKRMLRMTTGFSIVVFLFAFIGLTVHYWNYMWIFWGVCLGIRGSLREWSLAAGAEIKSWRRPEWNVNESSRRMNSPTTPFGLRS